MSTLAQTVAILVSVFSLSAAVFYDCASYESPACTQLAVPPCNTSSKTCYAHSNVCGSLRRYFTSGYIGTGWTVVLSSYSFACTPSNIQDCITESAITATTPMASSPAFCIPPNMALYKNNVTFRTLGSHPATIFTPTPSATIESCSVLKFLGQNIALSSININASNCNTAGVPTVGVSLGDSGAVLKDLEFYGTQIMVAITGSACDNISLVNVDAEQPVVTAPFDAQIILTATACDNTLPIKYTSASGNTYAAILTGPPTLIESSQLEVLQFNTFQTNYIYQPPQCPACNTTACPVCTSSTNYIYIIIPLMIVVAILVIYGLSRALKKTRAKLSHTQ